MQPDTGHLVDIKTKLEGLSPEEMQEKLEDLQAEGYQEIPESHRSAAKKKLAGKPEATVSLTSGGKLSKLCAKWRKEKNKKYRAKLGPKEVNRRREKRRQRAAAKKGE
jgi:hypothetical protein